MLMADKLRSKDAEASPRNKLRRLGDGNEEDKLRQDRFMRLQCRMVAAEPWRLVQTSRRGRPRNAS